MEIKIKAGLAIPCLLLLLVTAHLSAQTNDPITPSTKIIDKIDQQQMENTINKFGFYGKLKARQGKGVELASVLLRASQLVSTAKGCMLYLVNKDQSNPDLLWVTEIWDSKEDHDNSLKNEKVRLLIAEAMPLLDGQPEKGIELQVLGGIGLTLD